MIDSQPVGLHEKMFEKEKLNKLVRTRESITVQILSDASYNLSRMAEGIT